MVFTPLAEDTLRTRLLLNKKSCIHTWVNRNFFCSVVGALVENNCFVGKLKQLRGFVGEIQAKRSSVGEIETKQLSVGEFVTFYFTCG